MLLLAVAQIFYFIQFTASILAVHSDRILFRRVIRSILMNSETDIQHARGSCYEEGSTLQTGTVYINLIYLPIKVFENYKKCPKIVFIRSQKHVKNKLNKKSQEPNYRKQNLCHVHSFGQGRSKVLLL